MRIFFSHRLDEVENKRSILDHPRKVIDIALNLIPINLWVFISVLHRGFVPLTTDYVARAYINIDIVFNTHRQLYYLGLEEDDGPQLLFLFSRAVHEAALYSPTYTRYTCSFVYLLSLLILLNCLWLLYETDRKKRHR